MRLHRRAAETNTRMLYKLLSVLLQYPEQAIQDAGGEVTSAIATLPPSKQREAVQRFWSWCLEQTPTQRAQNYVETFDFQQRCSLYLSFYLEGDKRQRGMILLRLKRLYAAAGLITEGKELPDYLPVLLEFAALAPESYGEAILAELRPAIEVVRKSLRDLGSPYVHLLDALCLSLPRLSALEAERVRHIVSEGPPTERVGLEPFAPPEVMPMEARR